MDSMACLLQDTPINPYVQLVDAMTRFITPLWMGLALIMVSYRCDALLPPAANVHATAQLPCLAPFWQLRHVAGTIVVPSASDMHVTAGITASSAAQLVSIFCLHMQ